MTPEQRETLAAVAGTSRQRAAAYAARGMGDAAAAATRRADAIDAAIKRIDRLEGELRMSSAVIRGLIDKYGVSPIGSGAIQRIDAALEGRD
jgi:hypothetical protein